MKYTKENILKLDTKTIDFCQRWLWDALRRARLTENTGRTKAIRQYNHDFNNGLDFGFDLLRKLKKYNTGAESVASEISLLDDEIRE